MTPGLVPDKLMSLGRRAYGKLDRAYSASTQGFRCLRVKINSSVDILLPSDSHRYWTGECSDRELIEFLARYLPSGTTFLDVGANVGIYSTAIWKLRDGEVGCVAFEPVPATVSVLKSTFELNGAPLRVEGVAITDQPGVLKLTAYEKGRNNFIITNGSTEHPVVEVPAIRLDDWYQENQAVVPAAMKIDVEGFELDVLKGARELLRRFKPALVMECHAASWAGLGVDRAELVDELQAIGYRRMCDRRGGDVDILGAKATFHLLGIP